MPKQDDKGILTPWGKRFFKIVGLLIGLALLIAFALSDRAGAEEMAGNRGACAEGNKVRGLPCVITAFQPGYVSGTCDGGLTFSRVRTARTFRDQQPVTAQGCIGGNGWQLTSAPGMPLRISR